MSRVRRGVLRHASLVALGCCVTLLSVSPASADGPEASAKRVEAQLIAPCCFMQTLANHSSPKADRMKREIRELLRQGWSEDQVVQYYLDTYGERILAVPLARGFNLLAYLTPLVFVLAGGLVCILWLRRRLSTDRHALADATDAPAHAIDPALVERMRAELATFD